MTKTTILITSIIAMTFILLVTTSYAYAAGVTDFFWSEDDGTGEIFTADAATTTVSQVTSGGFVRIDDVEYDPLNAKLWWNNWGAPAFFGGPSEGIYSANADGTVQVQVTGSLTFGAPQFTTNNGEASGLTGLVLDPANSQLFFTRGVSYAQGFPPNAGGEVSRVNMDGSGYLKLNINNDSWHPDGIELDTSTGTLLWGDPGVFSGITATGPVNCMDTSGGSRDIANLPHVTAHGRSLALDAANGLLFYSSHNVLGRSSGGGIFVTSPCPSPLVAPNQVLTDPATGIPDIELDTANMRIYWTDYARGEIRSASYDVAGNLSPITIELSGLDRPYGLALRFNQDPSCTGVPSETLLWPPNHKFVDISISGVTDPDGDPVTITVTGITQDEPTNGLGDGDTSPDGDGVGTDTAQVRAERSGLEDGRVYEISYEATDGFGGSCSGSVLVGVPHDQKKPVTAVDSGQAFDSTIP